MRICGVDIPDNKRIVYSLSRIVGIGVFRAKKICEDLNISENLNMKELNDDQVAAIEGYISSNFVVGDDLKRIVVSNKKNKIAMKCFVGVRLAKGLPKCGSARSNGKTAKAQKFGGSI